MFVNQTAVLALAAADPHLGNLITQIGPCGLEPDSRRTPFEGLVRAVAHQQLSGRVAEKILSRFVALFPANGGFPTPQQVNNLALPDLTGVGFSRSKAGYIQGIARGALEGLVPSRREIEMMDDEAIVERLTQLKGIGRWSVEMFLIFGLGRPDVLPIHDFGIRSGFAAVYRKRKLPKPAYISKHGERWKPYRTTAAWYLWRAVDSKP
jgi:DNA-3-methyladenine glycosylase II